MRSKLFLLFFCLLLSGGRLFAVEAHPSLTLFSQLRIEHEDMAIAEDDWAWLRQGHLRLGAALDETSPFNVRLDDENYEGITADVATLVGQLLGMRIKVVSFDTHADAVAALAAGKIDLLGSHYSSAGDSSWCSANPTPVTDWRCSSGWGKAQLAGGSRRTQRGGGPGACRELRQRFRGRVSWSSAAMTRPLPRWLSDIPTCISTMCSAPTTGSIGPITAT